MYDLRRLAIDKKRYRARGELTDSVKKTFNRKNISYNGVSCDKFDGDDAADDDDD